MKLFAFLVVLITHCQGRAFVGDTTILLDRQEKGLEWPLPNVLDPGTFIVHGRHCFAMLEIPTNESDVVRVIHKEHCRDVTKKLLQFLEADPSHKANDWICKAITKSLQTEPHTNTHMRKRDIRQDPKNLGGYGTDLGGYGALELDSDKKKREVQQQNSAVQSGYVADLRQYAANLRGYGALELDSDKKKREVILKSHGPTGFAQTSTLFLLSIDNFGKLITKQWTSPNSLTSKEQSYLEKWETPTATALGALGLYCYVDGDLDRIRIAVEMEN